MRDERKEEIKRRVNGRATKSVVILLSLTIVSVLCMVFLIYKFIVMDVIVPDITINTTLIGVTFILLIISSIAISNARDLGIIKEIVMDNKITLEDTVSMESIAMDEIIQLKNLARDIRNMVE